MALATGGKKYTINAADGAFYGPKIDITVGTCVCCSVLQRVAVCCVVLHCVAACYSVLQCVVLCCSVLQRVAVCCSNTQLLSVADGVFDGP